LNFRGWGGHLSPIYTEMVKRNRDKASTEELKTGNTSAAAAILNLAWFMMREQSSD